MVKVTATFSRDDRNGCWRYSAPMGYSFGGPHEFVFPDHSWTEETARREAREREQRQPLSRCSLGCHWCVERRRAQWRYPVPADELRLPFLHQLKWSNRIDVVLPQRDGTERRVALDCPLSDTAEIARRYREITAEFLAEFFSGPAPPPPAPKPKPKPKPRRKRGGDAS